jgi:hypothetical protein
MELLEKWRLVLDNFGVPKAILRKNVFDFA